MSPAVAHFLHVVFVSAAIALPVTLILAAWALASLELYDGERR